MVFGTCHVKTRGPVYVSIGRSYAVFVIPADGNRQRPEFRTGKALLAVGVVTVGAIVAAKPHTHIRSSASLIRSGLGRTAGVRRLLMGDNCGEQRGRQREIKGLLTRGLGARRTYFLCSLCHHSRGYLGCMLLSQHGILPVYVCVNAACGRALLWSTPHTSGRGRNPRRFCCVLPPGVGARQRGDAGQKQRLPPVESSDGRGAIACGPRHG